MSRKARARLTSLLPTAGFSLAILTGCQDAVRPERSPHKSARQLHQAPPSAAYETLDDEFARLAVETPGGFAGLYVDSGGTLVVRLTDVSQRGAALASLEQTLRRHTEGRYSSDIASLVRTEYADFRYDDLKRWRDFIDLDWSRIPGLVMSDIDEVSNRIELGFKEPVAAVAALTKVLHAGGIPTSAVRSVVWNEIPTKQLLNDLFTSIPGGVNANAVGRAWCSTGVNVLYNGIPAFITASHCGLTQGAMDGASWEHHGFGIGVEIADPGSICPAYVGNCRRSDAAIIQYNGSIPGELGMIARTTSFHAYPPVGSGSTTIDPSQPRFSLVWPGYPTSNPLMNEQVEKMGRVTGWIRGPINKTCFGTTQDTGWMLFCNYRFYGTVIDGDSGGPIFHRITCPGESWPAVNCASFAGILWGGEGGQVYFSPTNNIFADFSPASLVFVN